MQIYVLKIFFFSPAVPQAVFIKRIKCVYFKHNFYRLYKKRKLKEVKSPDGQNKKITEEPRLLKAPIGSRKG